MRRAAAGGLLAFAAMACAPHTTDPTAAALSRALQTAEGDGSKVRVHYYKVSPSGSLYCGHANVGGRSAVFAIRWNPELRGDAQVLRQPSIDKAPPAERDLVRSSFMRITSDIAQTCLQEGAPLGA